MAFEVTDKSRLFLNELAQFYRNKGQLGVTPQHLVARLDGREVDLWDLYSAVLEMGGSFKVNQLSQWDKIYERIFKINPHERTSEDNDNRPSGRSSHKHRPAIGVNVSVALRQIYQRYLMPYERVNYSNFSHDVADEDEDDSRTTFSTSNTGSNRDSLAASYVIHSSLTQSQPSASKLTHQPDPLNRLFCSLVSGLSNEMDFGLRIVTMLVNSRQIDAIADFKLVDVLLECCDLSICQCHERGGEQAGRTSFQVSCEKEQSNGKCFCISRFWSKKCKDESLSALLLDDVRYSCQRMDLNEDEMSEKIGNRIKRIADLIRTITECIQEYQESEEESTVERAPVRLLRFAALLLASEDTEFKAMALDIISNVNLIKSREEDYYATLVNQIVCHSVSLVINDNDLAIVGRAIRALTHVSAAGGADELGSAFEALSDESLINRLIELLTCQHDVTLLTATLELCWTISENSPRLLTRNNKSLNQLLKILLNLLNCDASTHFTPQALKHVRVCDMRGRNQIRPTGNMTQSQQSAPQAIRSTSQSLVPNANNAAVISESESFVVSWLKGLYESTSRSHPISISEMYTDYIRLSCKNGRKNVVSAQSFSQIISRTFPSVTITSNHVDGLSIKSQPSTPRKGSNPAQGQLTSPILKAHLCAPPKSSSSVVTLNTGSTTTGTTTTLIKSLLANKLRSNSQSNSNKTESGDSGSDIKAAQKKTTTNDPMPEGCLTNATLTSTSQNILTTSTQPVLISTTAASGPGLPGQAPQQFLLVRTIIQPGTNQTGVQSGVRLILPASVYTNQRPVVPQAAIMNGNSVTTSPPAQNPSQQPNDILLKAVLGSGIVSDSTPTKTETINSVKSSPLLNVLLDKGKFPESTSNAVVPSSPTVSQAAGPPQQDNRVFILTTGSPIKSVNHTSDVGPMKNGIPNDTTVSSNLQSISSSVKLKSPPAVNCRTDTVLTNGDICGAHISDCDKKVNSLPNTDLSSVKDMKKAIDDAPKLISKRHADEGSQGSPVKKAKIEDQSSDQNASKVASKILPSVNGEIKVPVKVSPEKSSSENRPLVTASPPVPPVTPSVPTVLEYICEWHDCKKSFPRPALVFKHVYESHVFSSPAPKHCMWGGSEGMGPGCLSPRPQLSLLTHLQDFHCSPSILQQAALKRQQLGNTTVSVPGNPAPAPPAHPGYAQNAALLAIRRLNCIEPVPVPVTTATTPITVSIRLTAALIIRNVAAVSSEVRRCLQRHERSLSEMCVSPGRDESRTIAQCLALVQNVWRR